MTSHDAVTPLTEIQKLNQALADKINAEARADPTSPYAGKFVGIANGHVVAVAETLREMLRLLRLAEPDPARTFYIEANRDYSVPEYIGVTC